MKIQNHWKFLFINGLFAPLIGALLFGIIVYFSATEDDRTWEVFKFFGGICLAMLIATFAPLIFLHYHYYDINKNTTVENNGIRILNKFYLFEDVKQVWINKPNSFRNPFADYFYVKLVLKTQEEIFLTALLSDEIVEVVLNKCKNAKVFREQGCFAGFPEW